MSELRNVIHYALERDIRAAARGEANAYPAGRERWVEVRIEMAKNEIAQWLEDAESVDAHLLELRNRNTAKAP